MKHLKKITLVVAIAALLFSVSCSKDDDGTIDLAAVEFAFDQSNPPIEQAVINNLVNSDDENAALTGTYLSTANLMTIWLSYFNQPSNAIQADSPIGGICGDNSVTYTWTSTAGTESFTVAYQICETDEDYIFQVFWSVNGGDFQQIIYAEESKAELRNGYMQLFATNPNAEVGSTVVLEYAWVESADGSFDYTVSNDEQGFLMEISVEADNSGSLSYSFDGALYYTATWDATGNSGTYAYYSDGSVTESGTW
ncbi:hypothetical protein [Ekhidna sp. To15]|uniref:hypothetical protein n=1 Tax=Ekhidna sp. To15 TaxID=3395267 RepID=UPI003F51DF02